jgi:3-hydroxyacyl-CoA dehydrogenase/enoyl-CoA hydratase/3-hydroxybutyryl-CoA epimerase
MPTSSSRRCSRTAVKKADVTKKAEAVLKSGVVFASNTSTLPITGLAQNSVRPDQFIGIHFFSPVDKMMLVEIIIGAEDRRQGARRRARLCPAIKKTPIVVNDTRGFYVNRCVFRYIKEAHLMLIEGVPAVMIENARQAGRHAGRPAVAQRRGRHRPRPEDPEGHQGAISAPRPSIRSRRCC